ncbi:MAG: tetratricopeptide repeat protein [Blastochloris sp.]|nr:tetratricopeptide repeat protein [Blastochloris sp.]
MAQTLLREHPENPTIRVTAAFALYRKQQYKEALELLNRLPAETWQDPRKALYYALILRATGQSELAALHETRAAASPDLLPEERLLLDPKKLR